MNLSSHLLGYDNGKDINPLIPTVAPIHLVPVRVKPILVVFDIWAL